MKLVKISIYVLILSEFARRIIRKVLVHESRPAKKTAGGRMPSDNRYLEVDLLVTEQSGIGMYYCGVVEKALSPSDDPDRAVECFNGGEWKRVFEGFDDSVKKVEAFACTKKSGKYGTGFIRFRVKYGLKTYNRLRNAFPGKSV